MNSNWEANHLTRHQMLTNVDEEEAGGPRAVAVADASLCKNCEPSVSSTCLPVTSVRTAETKVAPVVDEFSSDELEPDAGGGDWTSSKCLPFLREALFRTKLNTRPSNDVLLLAGGRADRPPLF